MNPRLLALVLSCLLVATGVLAVVAGRLDGRPPAHADDASRPPRAEVEALAVLQRVGRAPVPGLGVRGPGRPARPLHGRVAVGSPGSRAAGGVRRSRAAGDRSADPGAGGRRRGDVHRGPAGARRHRPDASAASPSAAASRAAAADRPAVDLDACRWCGSRGSGGWRRFRPVPPRARRGRRDAGTGSPRPRERPAEGSASAAARARLAPRRTSAREPGRTAGARRCTARANSAVNSALVGVSGQQRLNWSRGGVVLRQGNDGPHPVLERDDREVLRAAAEPGAQVALEEGSQQTAWSRRRVP